MADDAQPINLTNHFLIAMPGMVDGTFSRSVVYVCEHSQRGALGLIINKPGDISLAEGLAPDQTVYASTLAVPGGLEMTTSKDVLEALSSGAGPRRVLVTLGYASWGEGQLESEIARNSWLTVDADADLIFEAPIAQRYDLALRRLGLEAWMLSPDIGHALAPARPRPRCRPIWAAFWPSTSV